MGGGDPNRVLKDQFISDELLKYPKSNLIKLLWLSVQLGINSYHYLLGRLSMNQKCFNPADMSHDNMDKTNTLINENIKKLPTQGQENQCCPQNPVENYLLQFILRAIYR